MVEQSKKNGFSTAGLVLGIIGICTSFIPLINNLSFVIGAIAIIFGIVALIQKAGKGKIIVTIILGILSIIITLNSQKALSDSFNAISNDLDNALGSSTEEILANDADVIIGNFEVTNGEYLTETKLNVKVTNKTSETKSFNIQIEAISADGTRLASDYIYANNLTAGQSQNFETFNFVESDKIEEMKNATFKIVEISMY